MANALVRGFITDIKVKFNGDRKDEKKEKRLAQLEQDLERAQAEVLSKKDKVSPAVHAGLRGNVTRIENQIKNRKAELEAKDNVIAASFVYPRSGASQLVVARNADLESNEIPWEPQDGHSVFGRILFKEEIQGETQLVVAISDKDPANSIVTFLRSAASALFGSLAGGVVKGLSGVVTAASAGEVQGLLGKSIKGDGKGKETVIARSEKVDIRIGDDGAVEIKESEGVAFDGENLTLTLFSPTELKTGKAIAGIKKIEKGNPNGSIVLALDGEKL